MINRIKDVALAKGYKNALALAQAAGLSQGTVYPLWRGDVSRIDFSTIDKLCDTLQVPVGMLLEHRPDEKEA